MKYQLSKNLSILILGAAVIGSALPAPAMALIRASRVSWGPVASSASPAPKKYIVVLKNNAGTGTQGIASTFNLQPQYVYHSALHGFAAALTPELLSELKKDPRVQFISEDKEVHLLNLDLASKNSPVITDSYIDETIPTGVRRINGPGTSYQGDGVTVAIIDTGIDLSHPDLRDGIIAQTNCTGFSASGNDDHGHGSHVSGIIAARKNGIGVVGVAPHANLVAVKVLDANGSGSFSSVICGIDWVTAHAKEYNIRVANMSLGGWGSSDNNCGNTNDDPMHKALCNSAAAGVTYVVAAGNSDANASTTVPAAYNDTLITVSALADSDGKPFGQGAPTSWGNDDTFANFSNYGPEVDLGAPGVDIFSCYKNGGYTTMSGTSMASPHVAGAAALYIQAHPEAKNWRQVRDGLRSMAATFYVDHTDPTGNHPEPIVRLDFDKATPSSVIPIPVFASSRPTAQSSVSNIFAPSKPMSPANIYSHPSVVPARAAVRRVGASLFRRSR